MTISVNIVDLENMPYCKHLMQKLNQYVFVY